MKKGAASALAVLLLGACRGEGAGAAPSAGVQLAQVKASNQRYQYAANAILDGYYPTGSCIQGTGGALGLHYLNRRYLGRLDPLHPPELFYVPVDGSMALAGVEYYAPAAGGAAPALFGRRFEGPMPGHVPGQPEHYDLHVWLWVSNPAGLFAPSNPAVGCA